ncbi:MAG: FAD-dependent oxidoreductase [Kiritimatiellaeota bacterium]|nr:FAD-dependent oxidoreductase [Kiritimatiellota bacterium]
MSNYERKYDVVVCGAGVAGIAAAVKCVRSGLETCLVEKTIIPGGLATAGLVNIFLPLCDGNGNQILHGLPEEFLKLSVKYGPESPPAGWGGTPGTKQGRYMTAFSPAAFILALDELLDESGVDVWYDTLLIDARLSGRRLEAVEVVNKSGRGLLTAKAFIDATGDADIAKLAGCELREGVNHMSIWAIQASMKKAAAAIEYEDPSLLLDVVRLGADDKGDGHPEGEKKFRGVNGRNVSEFVVASRRLLRERYANLAENALGRYCGVSEFPLTFPLMPQFRKTRMIVGEEDVVEVDYPAAYSGGDSIFPDWRSEGRLWTVPAGALRPRGVDALFAAGRILSAIDDDAWDAARVIPVAAFTGERAADLARSS